MDLIQHVNDCLNKTDKLETKLNQEVLSINGMIGLKTKIFYNNLLSMKNSKYLEIGCFKGASVCNAMYDNEAYVVCIDNFCEFGNNRDELLNNLNKFAGKNVVYFIENDCFNVDLSMHPKFNIYMYDGNHDEISQYKALSILDKYLENEFIFVVDDWNHKPTRDGTQRAIHDMNYKILFEKEIRLSNDDTVTSDIMWWNGCYVAVLQKQ